MVMVVAEVARGGCASGCRAAAGRGRDAGAADACPAAASAPAAATHAAAAHSHRLGIAITGHLREN